MKTKTIEQLARKPAGSFKKFIQHKEQYIREIENERKGRIAAAR